MTTAYTSLLGLALPVTGELSGTWGDTVNNSITSLLDSAIAGTQTITADTTLTTTTGAANQSRQAILLCSPASVNITITAPAQSKIYTVINTSATYTVTVRGVGPTTGVTLGVSEKAVVAWNGSDFIKISNTAGAGSFTTLSATGVATFSAGTAAAPAITTTGDTNTGIFFPAADTIAFSEGGAESMRIDSSGNLGIGTTSPSGRLHVFGNVGDMLRLDRDNIGAVGNQIAFRHSNAGTLIETASINVISTANADTGTLAFYTKPTGGSNTERARIDSSGNLLVGTTTSNGRLTVEQNAADTTISVGRTGYTATKLIGGTLSDGNGFKINVNGGDRLAINSSGNVGIGTTSPLSKLNVFTASASGGGKIRISGDTDAAYGELIFSSSNVTYEAYGASISSLGTGGVDGGVLIFNTGSGGVRAEKMRLDGSGSVGIGTTSPSNLLHVYSTSGGNTYAIVQNTTSGNAGINIKNADGDWTLIANAALRFTNSGGEKMRITSSGDLLVGKTASTISIVGVSIGSGGGTSLTVSNNEILDLNRLSSDGTLQRFYQDSTAEGSISVSGTTVSYNGGHLSRYAQTTTAKDESIVKGTVLSNLNEMNVYTDADGNPVDNEQLNKVKVSDTEGDINVAGVFVNWSHDEDHNVDEINMAMTGDMIIRIAQGVTVARGDLLMSAGDGTAKPQGDDIVRSKTVAKVTSTHVTCTYADGSYCVPCVLMAC